VRRASGIALASLFVLALPRESAAAFAPAEDGATVEVGVLPLTFGPEVDTRMHKALDEGLLQGIGRGAGNSEQLEGAPDNCDRDCRDQIGESAGVGFVVWGEVAKSGPDFKVRLSAHEVGSTRGPIEVEGNCEICGETELADRVADLSASLEARIEDPSSRQGTLVLTGSPTGAAVFVDGIEVGTTPYEGAFEPGEHQIEIRKRGFGPQSQTWNADEGVSDRIGYKLDKAKGDRSTPAFVRPLGYALAGVGVGLIATGAVFLTLDGKDHDTTCTDELMDVDGDCPFRYATKTPGIGMLVGGVVAAGAGAGLLTWSFVTDGKTKAQASVGVGTRSVSVKLRF
jgi:hypothetical protein